MALSDRIALLRDGVLEQVAAPRNIYAHPATAYVAQFIGQTNLLHASIFDGVASCGELSWPVNLPDGVALFSLRPEAIRLGSESSPSTAGRFRARIQRQVFAGSAEHLEVDCDGMLLRVHIPARGTLAGERDFVFNPADAVLVRE